MFSTLQHTSLGVDRNGLSRSDRGLKFGFHEKSSKENSVKKESFICRLNMISGDGKRATRANFMVDKEPGVGLVSSSKQNPSIEEVSYAPANV